MFFSSFVSGVQSYLTRLLYGTPTEQITKGALKPLREANRSCLLSCAVLPCAVTSDPGKKFFGGHKESDLWKLFWKEEVGKNGEKRVIGKAAFIRGDDGTVTTGQRDQRCVMLRKDIPKTDKWVEEVVGRIIAWVKKTFPGYEVAAVEWIAGGSKPQHPHIDAMWQILRLFENPAAVAFLIVPISGTAKIAFWPNDSMRDEHSDPDYRDMCEEIIRVGEAFLATLQMIHAGGANDDYTNCVRLHIVLQDRTTLAVHQIKQEDLYMDQVHMRNLPGDIGQSVPEGPKRVAECGEGGRKAKKMRW